MLQYEMILMEKGIVTLNISYFSGGEVFLTY